MAGFVATADQCTHRIEECDPALLAEVQLVLSAPDAMPLPVVEVCTRIAARHGRRLRADVRLYYNHPERLNVAKCIGALLQSGQLPGWNRAAD